ncbi:MAG: hypothetical protein ACI861_000667 [Paracoccaceae bacterium]|jgi:hypothetical protein
MGRIIKWIFILVVIGFLVVLGKALFGDLSAPQGEVTKEVTIDVD